MTEAPPAPSGQNRIGLSKADYDAMQEALYLFSTPANARR
jgi:PHD/YefM family antitoxin component YafN of YafNO toxin-antitoxin module